MPSRAPPIVLFDGLCTLCDGAVQFIIDHDPSAQFRFASLQSDSGQRLAREHGVDASALDTLVLIDAGHALTLSDAVLGIARRLGRPWSWATALSVIPRPARDAVYRLVARNRTRWFGQRAACRIPTPELRARFLS